jgi:hypothetical protein
MFARLGLVLLLVLSACATPAPGASPEPIPMPTAAVALELFPADLVTPRCEAEAPALRVYLAPRLDVEWACTAGRQHVDVSGCFKSRTRFSPGELGAPSDTSRPWVFAANDDHDYTPAEIVAHELGHWLFSCSGLGADNSNHNDALFQAIVESLVPSWAGRHPVHHE